MCYERDDKGGKLEAFDGPDPAAYKMWRHRAKMVLAGLPPRQWDQPSMDGD